MDICGNNSCLDCKGTGKAVDLWHNCFSCGGRGSKKLVLSLAEKEAWKTKGINDPA